MRSMRDANLGDIYVDGTGKLWRVIWTCPEPSIGMEAVEPTGYIEAPEAIDIATGQQAQGTFIREKRQGGVSGSMWGDFIRIWQKKP